jgi:hypothetical protein
MELHSFMDSTKSHIPDNRHRLILHNSWGIFFVEKIFGPVWVRPSDGKPVPTRAILEQHVLEDLRYIPTLEQCFAHVPLDSDLSRNALPLSRMEEENADTAQSKTVVPIDGRIPDIRRLDHDS